MLERVCADNEGILNHNLYCLNHFHILSGIVVCADDKSATKLHSALKSGTAVNARIIPAAFSSKIKKRKKPFLSSFACFRDVWWIIQSFLSLQIKAKYLPIFPFYTFMSALCLHKWVDHKLELLGNFLILGNSGKSLPLKILSLMRHTKWTWLSQRGTRAKHSISVG